MPHATRPRLYPPRPRTFGRGQTEPSLPASIQAVVALVGAKNALTSPRARHRLELAGMSWDEIAPVLAPVRTVEEWGRRFQEAALAALAASDFQRAATLAFLGQIVLSPFNPRKTVLLTLFRQAHLQYRSNIAGRQVTPVSLQNGTLAGLWEVPDDARPLPVVIMPPLASIKEELDLLAEPLLASGFPVLRLDLPGQGQSAGPLHPHSENEIRRALDEMHFTQAIVGGISLGAYYAVRIGGTDGKRIKGVFGISPPAILTPEQWAKQPEVIYQYLDLYFATETREETYQQGLAMTPYDVAPNITAPALLYHGTRDRLSLPDVAARYHDALRNAPLTEYLLPDGHACLNFLKDRIGPEVARWCVGVADSLGTSQGAAPPVAK